MLSKDPQFRKLKIRARGPGGSSTYWLGPDHLLIVSVDGYHERYRRIYYRDIQAIIIRRTSSWIMMALLIMGLMIVGGVLPMTSGDPVGLTIGGTILGIFVVILIAHLIGGPSCGCRLVTAVQNRDLPHLNRWKLASRLMDELQVEVNRVQRSGGPATTSTTAELEPPDTTTTSP